MQTVLGISLSTTHAGLVIVDGVGGDATTVIRDSVAGAGVEAVAAAAGRVVRSAEARGYRVGAAGLVCTGDAERHGPALATLLADSGIAAVRVFGLADAAAALAETIGLSKGCRRTAVGLITEDRTVAVLFDGRARTHCTAVTAHRYEAPSTSLLELPTHWRPNAVFAIDTELGLARAAAIAAANAVVDHTPTVVTHRRRPDSVLVAAIAVTLLAAAITVAQVRGALTHHPSTLGSTSAHGHSAPVGAAIPAPAPSGVPPESIPTPRVRPQPMAEPLVVPTPLPVALPAGGTPAPPPPIEEPAPSPIQDAIAQLEQALGIDVDNDGVIGDRAAAPAATP